MRKIVLNKKYGGFNLSVKAIKRLHEIKHLDEEVYLYEADGFYKDSDFITFYRKLDFIDDNLNESRNIYVSTKDLGDIANDELEDFIIVNEDWDTRHDPALVQVVEELGEEASGRYSKLEIEEIDDDDKYVIDEYDGLEHLILRSRVANWNWQ